ncbi:MAG: large subunit ribosomal protein L9 [Candidatus Berkelbacteria bacterium Athens1014_28]|uniref:Large ribosomal subunit protein bL9 n=1 Tax=Candidatus Berkelbacteria bacterium Athens1014_28 TaxID=2017145 RepID=A0A554LLG5_9BACT|nr:MAG: large subunit ribosomal protein L9 [Candidatus Berkelbacteria bacterium Athens1014_28]
MKVVFLVDVKNVAKSGDEKDVKPGYARNFLIPKKLAVSAESAEGKALLTKKLAEAEKIESEKNQIMEALEKHQGLVVAFKKEAKDDKLFGSVKPDEVVAEIERIVGFSAKSIEPDKPIKKIGETEVVAEFADGEKLNVKVDVSATKVKKK